VKSEHKSYALFTINRVRVLFTKPRVSLCSRECLNFRVLLVSRTSAVSVKGVVTVGMVHMSGISSRRTTTSRRWTCYVTNGQTISKNAEVYVRKPMNSSNRSLKESSGKSRRGNWRQYYVMKWGQRSQSDVDIGSRLYVIRRCIGIYHEYCSVLLPSTWILETSIFVTVRFSVIVGINADFFTTSTQI
jgi:hypothetical protein